MANITGLSQALLLVVAATQAAAFQHRLRPALHWLARPSSRVAAELNGVEGPSFSAGTVELGTVLTANNDGLVVVESRDETQTAAAEGRIVNFSGGAEGIVVCVRPPLYFIQTSPETAGSVKVESSAHLPSDDVLKIPVGKALAGRTVDYTGSSLTGEDVPLSSKKRVTVFNSEPDPEARAPISRGLRSGLTAIEALTPMGLGQSMLVVGSEAEPKRHVAWDIVRAVTAQQGVNCVVACLDGGAAAVKERLDAAGDTTTSVFTVPDGAGLGTKLLTATAAVAAAESFRNDGKDALVVVDDLAALRDFWDMTSWALLEKCGNDRVDMMADSELGTYYSAVLRRSAQLGSVFGGGSLTVLALLSDQPATDQAVVDVTPQREDGSYEMAAFDGVFYSNTTRARLQALVARGIPVTDDVCAKLGVPSPKSQSGAAILAKSHVDKLISTVDGHLTLSADLHAAGQYPPVDPAESLCRVGSQKEATDEGRKRAAEGNRGMVGSAAMREVTGKLRLELAAQADLRFNTDAANAEAQRRRVAAWQAALHQPRGTTLALGDMVLGLLAASAGFLDSSNEPRAAVEALRAYAQKAAPELVGEVNETADLSDATLTALKTLARGFFE